MVDTDRSFTGQDGQAISLDQPGHSVPALLGRALFDLDLGIDHLHVLQNTVSVHRPGGWDEDAIGDVTRAVGSFLRFYPD